MVQIFFRGEQDFSGRCQLLLSVSLSETTSRHFHARFSITATNVCWSQLPPPTKQDSLSPINTGRRTRHAHKFERFSFDVTCMQCGHSHSHQQVPFACVPLVSHPVFCVDWALSIGTCIPDSMQPIIGDDPICAVCHTPPPNCPQSLADLSRKRSVMSAMKCVGVGGGGHLKLRFSGAWTLGEREAEIQGGAFTS